ncbi:SMI1/KNR4 family protein [Mangrovibacillus cuniculi]|uniref:SMI1/KNR4 family protein n=1 Tax=Mangrovibacillus cuniculi TaxID=2593652 RepID=A0A7S8C9F6_9BACI|nr:SMI1/KNR4 family protein [Mangrovibacillus cuniculi]QPC45856.1 SMI1/KNR4 family protein [Mangrovibacillus cuniculi]
MHYYREKGFWDEKVLPAKNDVIEKAEYKLGVEFPKEYIELLKESNGGTLYFNKIHIQSYGKCRIPYFLGIDLDGTEEEDSEGIFSYREELKKLTLPENIVLLGWETYPHSCFAMDYTNCTEKPTVVYFYEDYSEADVPYSKTIVASSFKDFSPLLFHQPYLRPSQLEPSY